MRGMFSKNKDIEKIFLKSAVDVEIVLFARIYLNLFVNLKDRRAFCLNSAGTTYFYVKNLAS
jgi:raw score 3.40